MEVLGRVVQRIDKNNIKVEILRTSACGGKCGECSNSCGSKSYITARNFDGADVGDVVKIESDDKKVLILSFAVFIIPILIIILLYNTIGVYIKNESLNALVSFLGGVFSFLAVIIIFRRLKTPVSKIHFSFNRD